ncbi:MAG: hypothetical protein B0D92_06640 [Spirochaeta sp. LUC14_002_19_P3]|nr:MAG: hypothetical protein B0D92_06640 [Spirochaeta sp. LUC14_002_19_P3]
MKSIGDILKTAREERGISIDQVVHETNISRNYIHALEEEKFEIFPADAYLIGFLRSYADFLGLESDKVLGLYRNYKINEEPTPLKELIGPPRGKIAKKVLLWGLFVVCAGAAAVFGVPKLAEVLNNVRQQRQARAAEEQPEAREVRPEIPLWEGTVYPGDTLVLENEGENLALTLTDSDGRLRMLSGDESWSMLLGEEIYFPGDEGLTKWRIYLKDIGMAGGGAVLEVQQLPDNSKDNAVFTQNINSEPPSGVAERRREPIVILQSVKPESFTMNIDFRGFCLFRYKADNRSISEAAFAEGDSIRLDVDSALTIWASNAGVLSAKIKGKEVQLGRQGEVAVGIIRWTRNEGTGQSDLTLYPLY